MDNNEIDWDLARDITPEVKSVITTLIHFDGVKTRWWDREPVDGERIALPIKDQHVTAEIVTYKSYPEPEGFYADPWAPALRPRAADVIVAATVSCDCWENQEVGFTHIMVYQYITTDGTHFTAGYSRGVHPDPYAGVEYNREFCQI